MGRRNCKPTYPPPGEGKVEEKSGDKKVEKIGVNSCNLWQTLFANGEKIKIIYGRKNRDSIIG
jgi:hypothetical protein